MQNQKCTEDIDIAFNKRTMLKTRLIILDKVGSNLVNIKIIFLSRELFIQVIKASRKDQ